MPYKRREPETDPNAKRWVNLPITQGLMDRIDKMADNHRRSRSSMLKVILEDAVIADEAEQQENAK